MSWKGQPLVISPSLARYNELTPEEVQVCTTMRVVPDQYLYIKDIMLRAAVRGSFKKRDAQSWFKIDVNKVKKHHADLFRSTSCMIGLSDSNGFPEAKKHGKKISLKFIVLVEYR